jgi:tetratricopeptide (TPR) repeat protein
VSESESNSPGHFEFLLERGRGQIARACYAEALSIYDEALAWAERHGNRQQRDLTICSRAGVLQALGRGHEIVTQMQQVLMASPDPINKHLAAYNVSQHYEDVLDYEKGLFYARLACDHARRGDRPELLARALNRVGNTLMAQSRFEDACACYTEALEALGTEDTLVRAAVLDNLGYCHTVLGATREGFAALFAGLRMLRRLGLCHGEPQMHLDLCYAYLEIGRLRPAERHGRIALQGAEELGDPRQTKNCLYLLGDVAKLSGESRTAYAYFSRLQDEFYPENGMIPHLLMTNDFRQMVNLRA